MRVMRAQFWPAHCRDGQVVFFLLGALTIVEIMDAHKGSLWKDVLNSHRSTFLLGEGFDIITKLIQAKTQRELLAEAPKQGGERREKGASS